ncbi:MAG: hypothetical protein MJZ16_00545 [Bacteroidales bacterium]|nr:hypothetical protein [Bacteroidales bacterium]
MSIDYLKRIISKEKSILNRIVICSIFFIAILLLIFLGYKRQDTTTLPQDLDELYEYYSELLSKDGDQSAIANIKQEYTNRCVSKGLECISEQYQKHKDDNLLSIIVETYVLPGIDHMSFDDEYAIAKYYLDSPYQSRILETLRNNAIQSGPLEISNYYYLGFDKDFDTIAEYNVMEVLSSLPIKDVKLLLPYYKGTDFQNEIESEYLSMIQSQFNDLVAKFVATVQEETVQDSSIRQDLSNVYNSLYGNFFKKIKNTVLKKDETLSDDFTKIWNKEFKANKYKRQFSESIDRNLALYKISCDSILSDLGYSGNYLIPKSKDVILTISPSDSLRKAMNTKAFISVAKSIGLTAVDLSTISVTGWLNALLIAGEMTADIAIEQTVLKGTEELFIRSQTELIYEQIENMIDNVRDQLIDENVKVLNNILL